jgi:hydroxymethylpyrimidine/phosphomethylpyrimidine kinase
MIDARAHSLGAYKSSTFEDMQAFTEIALHITRESTMHVQVCPLLSLFSATSRSTSLPFSPIKIFPYKPSTADADAQYCSEFNITLPQLLRTPESSTTSAYARYILDIGTQGDILELYVAIAACLIGYGEVGLWLQKQVKLGEAKVEGNLYKRWMEDYGGEDFLGAVDRGIGAFSPTVWIRAD